MCGMLMCTHRAERLAFWKEALSYLMPETWVTQNGRQHDCKGAILDVGLNMRDPGMVPNGSPCAENKVRHSLLTCYCDFYDALHHYFYCSCTDLLRIYEVLSSLFLILGILVISSIVLGCFAVAQRSVHNRPLITITLFSFFGGGCNHMPHQIVHQEYKLIGSEGIFISIFTT